MKTSRQNFASYTRRRAAAAAAAAGAARQIKLSGLASSIFFRSLTSMMMHMRITILHGTIWGPYGSIYSRFLTS